MCGVSVWVFIHLPLGVNISQTSTALPSQPQQWRGRTQFPPRLIRRVGLHSGYRGAQSYWWSLHGQRWRAHPATWPRPETITASNKQDSSTQGSKAQPPAHVVVGLQGQETWLSLSHSLFFHQSTPNTIEGQEQFQRTSKHPLKSQDKVTDLFADVTAAVFFTKRQFSSSWRDLLSNKAVTYSVININ